MRPHDGKADFQDRIRRIEEKAQARRAEAEEAGYVPRSSTGAARRRGIWLAILSVPVLGGLLTFGAVSAPEKFDLSFNIAADADTEDLPEVVKPASATPSGPGSALSALLGGVGAVPLSGHPAQASPKRESQTGRVWASPTVLNDSRAAVAISEIVEDYVAPGPADMLAEARLFDKSPVCWFKSPEPGQKVVSVNLEQALHPAPVTAFNTVEMVEAVTRTVERVTRKNGQETELHLAAGDVRVVDVFVTDSSAPIYLVLQSLAANIIWNIHTAGDATVAHAALVGPGVSGIIVDSDQTKVEAMVISDFVGSHRFGADDTIRDCMIRPWRKPRPEWQAWQKAERGNQLMTNQIESYAKGYAAYDAWFTRVFGTSAAAGTLSAQGASHVLVGPIPDTKLSYRPISGAEAQIVRTDHVILGDADTRRAEAQAQHLELLTRAAGGDIAMLRPAVQNRGDTQ
ncbi:MAG: hypothetical protein AAGE38_10085 [Pseudomonadota bacterium]